MTSANKIAAPINAAEPRDTRQSLQSDKITTLVEAVEHHVGQHPKSNLFNYKRNGEWHSLSSAQVYERVRHVALGLYALGVKHGDRVALLGENSHEWILTDLGCLFLGAVGVPIYPTLAPAQVRYILQDSAARVLCIGQQELLDRNNHALEALPTLEHLVLFATPVAASSSAAQIGNKNLAKQMSFAELEARGETLGAEQPSLFAELSRKVLPSDLATIIYTSGTTGEPKGVMLTHANIVSNVISASAHFGFSSDDIALSVLPLSHVFERVATYMHIYNGVSVYLAESLEKLGENLREVRPTVLLGVPRLFEKTLARIKERAAAGGKVKARLLAWAVDVGKRWAEHALNGKPVPTALRWQHNLARRLVFAKWREGLGGRIRVMIAGGAALPEDLAYIFCGAGLPVMQGYGMTETSPVIAACTLDYNRIGTVGRPIPGVEVRVASDGEIETRGPHVMQGYYNKPEATRAAMTVDGWLRTGDIGSIDADGYLRLTERKKELFKTSGGKYIAPQAIEQRIQKSKFVNQVVLVGDGRRFPAALIVPDFNQLRGYADDKGIAAPTPAELCRHPRINELFQKQVDDLTTDLAQYERVKRITLLEHELTIDGGELTPTLKVKRRIVAQKYAELINRMYEESNE